MIKINKIVHLDKGSFASLISCLYAQSVYTKIFVAVGARSDLILVLFFAP